MKGVLGSGNPATQPRAPSHHSSYSRSTGCIMPSVLLLRRAWPSSEMILTCLRHVSYIGFFLKTVLHFSNLPKSNGEERLLGESGCPLPRLFRLLGGLQLKNEVSCSHGTATQSSLETHFLSSFLYAFFPLIWYFENWIKMY